MEPPRDLTLPEPGSTTTRRILGQYLKKVWADLASLPPGRFRTPAFDELADARGVLERALRDGEAGLVLSILRRPTVSTLVRCLHTELYGAGDPVKLDAWLAELAATLVLELAVAGRLPAEGLPVRQRPERLLSLGAELALVVDRARSLGFRPGRAVLGDGTLTIDLEAPGTLPDGVRIERPYHRIADGVLFACADNNPLAAVEAHPDKSGNALDLGGAPPQRWVTVLAASLALIDDHLPDLGREIREVLQLVVPVGADPERHLSASYAEAIGLAYLSLHPDPMTMTEALIHEFSHNKLNALFTLHPLLENAFEPLYPSPVRPDPRPLHGVLLAVHAFVPVARLYQRMLETRHPLAQHASFVERYRAIVANNHDGQATLGAHARPAPMGVGLLAELARWDAHFATT